LPRTSVSPIRVLSAKQQLSLAARASLFMFPAWCSEFGSPLLSTLSQKSANLAENGQSGSNAHSAEGASPEVSTGQLPGI
jgi:hypothetical protein